MRIDLFLLGFAEYAVSQEAAGEAFEALQGASVAAKGVKRYEKNGEIHFFCSLRAARRLPVETPFWKEVRRGGLPILARDMRRRPGLVLGCLLALLLMVGARLVLWDIEIEGNEQIPCEELRLELAAVGLVEGRYLPNLDGEAIALALRQGDGRIAYASVNMRGTVARVQIREAVVPPETVTVPADLVAAVDGVVVLPLVFEGENLVREGDVVRVGQVLAAGVIQGNEGVMRITRAAGQVWARTVRTYEVEMSFFYEEKVYLGRRTYDVELIFFGFRGKVFKNTRNLYIDCDIIQDIKMLTLPSGRTLPIGLAVTTHESFDRCEATRTAAEARRLALLELERQIATESDGRKVISRTVETVVDDVGVRLVCTLVCEEDIAVVREFAEIPKELG